MREAGCDGVEILVGMGYLHAQFLSPRTNVRSDAYGGSPERRLRFLRETLTAVREATSEDFIVGIRIAGEEFDPDGLDLKVTLDACRRLFGADRDTVYLQHTMTGDPVLCEDVDTLVLACGHQARPELYEALEGKVPELHAIGDCLSPRTAEEAVLEGLKVAALI